MKQGIDGRIVNRQSTLCWECARATLGTAQNVGLTCCSWAESFTPVKGWDAEARAITVHNSGWCGGKKKYMHWKRFEDSYFVKACPQFAPDAPRSDYAE